MSGRGQTVGDCGHRKGAYDDHLRCLSCAGCSISSTCNVCARWKQDTWAQVDRARTYKKRRTSKSSDASTPDVVPSPLPVPPVPACSSAASVSDRSGRACSTRSRWDLFNVPTEPLLPVVCGPTESAIPVVTPVTTKGGSLSGAPAPSPRGGCALSDLVSDRGHDGQTSALKSEARSSRKTSSHRRSSGKLSGQAALPGAFGSTTPTGPGADHLYGEGKPHRKTGSSSVSKAPGWSATRMESGANQRSQSGPTTGLAGRSSTDRPPTRPVIATDQSPVNRPPTRPVITTDQSPVRPG